MSKNIAYDNFYKFSHVQPIQKWQKYRLCMEYSDKLILPYTLLLDIRRNRKPLPPLFFANLARQRLDSVIVSVLNFSAEENHAYVPLPVLKKINFKPQIKDELVLELMPTNKKNLYPYPPVKRIEAFCEDFSDTNSCKLALLAYTVVTKGEWVKIMVQEKVYKIYIFVVYPKNTCIIKNGNFELGLKSNFPKTFAEQEGSLKKYSGKIISLNKTKTKFYEILSSRPYVEAHAQTPLFIRNKEKNNIKNDKRLRYTSHTWSINYNMPPINKDANNKTIDNIDIQPWDQDDFTSNKSKLFSDAGFFPPL